MRASKRSSAGFTLIEMVIVIVIIGTGLLGIVSLFSSNVRSLSINETLQQATQFAQECAENVLTTRRDNGFEWFANNTFSCRNLSANGFSGTAVVGDLYTGDGTGACPNSVNCRNVSITVANTTDTSITSVINLMLVDY